MGIILTEGGFFDTIVAVWFAREDAYEARMYAEHELMTDGVLRTKIATECVNERAVIRGHFGKFKQKLEEQQEDSVMKHYLIEGFDGMTTNREAIPELAYADAWDLRERNSRMQSTEDLLAKLAQY